MLSSTFCASLLVDAARSSFDAGLLEQHQARLGLHLRRRDHAALDDRSDAVDLLARPPRAPALRRPGPAPAPRPPA